MDNQQERLAYLAGIIDGEGYIGLYKRPTKGRYKGIDPIITVHMVAPEQVDYLGKLATEAGLPSYVIHLKDSSRWTVKGVKRCRRVARELEPYLFGKKKQAQIVLAYCDLRLLRPYRSDPSQIELDLIPEIQALNTKGKNPQRAYARLH